MRLDQFLHQNHFANSRNQAQELILNEKVEVDGKVCTKASLKIFDQKVTLLESMDYVGRGAYKLKSFFISHAVSPHEKTCLDIGSSTGGFVQVLCEFGAKSVTAVDVGRDQLHPSLKSNPSIISIEETDIRTFNAPYAFDFVTCDVSFVGITHILKDIDRLSRDKIVILFKPQFEVGRNAKRNKKGVVKDSKAIILALENFENLTDALGWKLLLKASCEIKGKEGNEEFFYYFEK